MCELHLTVGIMSRTAVFKTLCVKGGTHPKNLHWLATNQGPIDKRLFARRYQGHAVPRLFLSDVTRSYLEGRQNALGDWGDNRDGTKGTLQIVIGLFTDETGVPVSREVFQGHTHDPKTVMKPPRSKLRGIRRKGIGDETPRFLMLFPLYGNP